MRERSQVSGLSDVDVARIAREVARAYAAQRQEQITTKRAICAFLRLVQLPWIADAIEVLPWAWKHVKQIFQAVMTPARSGRFDRVWVDHDVVQNNVQGMLIHIALRVHQMKGLTCKIVAHFTHSDGRKLKDLNNRYRTVDGGVSASRNLAPLYDDTIFKDVRLFMPLDELHKRRGSHQLRFRVALYDAANSQLAISKSVPFTYDA